MQEYTTRAIILKKEPSRELDLRVTMFTRDFGKISAKATSGRKITSKLSAHLEPGNLSFIRLAETGGLQLTDALKEGRLALTPHDLYALDRLLPQDEPEPQLWEALAGDAAAWSWPDVLAILGWNPRETSCEQCRARAPEYFTLNTQSLYCAPCATASRIPQDAVLYVGNDREHMGNGKLG